MNLSCDNVSSNSQASYQKQKLYIEDLEINENFEGYESDFKNFLSKYGTIIDMKILKNRKLNRSTKILRICHLR